MTRVDVFHEICMETIDASFVTFLNALLYVSTRVPKCPTNTTIYTAAMDGFFPRISSSFVVNAESPKMYTAFCTEQFQHGS